MVAHTILVEHFIIFNIPILTPTCEAELLLSIFSKWRTEAHTELGI